MNLEESDIFKKEIERNSRHKKTVIISICVCVILMIFLIGLIIFIRYQDSITLKLFVDGKQVSIPNKLYKQIDGKTYVNLKQISSLLGYNYTKGVYGKYNEDEDSCYMQNDFEIVAVTAGESKYTKYIELTGENIVADIKVSIKSDAGYSESFKIENPVKYEDGNLYIQKDYISQMFNINYTWEKYRIKFYTLDYQVAKAKKTITSKGYKEMSGYYENLRAILDGFAIIGNGSKVYGVMSLADGKEIISLKYNDIKYVQNSKEFYITVADGTMGILAADGSTIIKPTEYEKISLLDEENQLYLVENNKEYGVLNRKGETIVFAENDKIGFDTSPYTLENIDNGLLLFGKCIPVKKDDKYGLYDVNGDMLLNVNYEDFGCKSTASSTTSGNEQSVLIIPSEVGINGIVIKYNNLYGIYDVNAKEIILTCVCPKIYAITKNGKTTYYMEFNGEQIELEQFLIEQGFKNIDENGEYKDKSENNASVSKNSNVTVDENVVEDTGIIVNPEEEENDEANS